MEDITPACVVDIKNQEDSISTLKKAMGKLPQIKVDTSHLVHGNMYARTIFIPAGSALTGVTTKVNNICIISGDISVTTDKGVVRLSGYHVIPANAGLSRAGFAHADTYWTTFFQTELTDIEAIEDSVTAESASLQTRIMKISNRSHKAIKD